MEIFSSENETQQNILEKKMGIVLGVQREKPRPASHEYQYIVKNCKCTIECLEI